MNKVMNNKAMTAVAVWLTILFSVSFLPASAATGRKVSPSKNYVTEKRTSAMNFTKIDVSSMIGVTVEERTDSEIIIRASDNIMPFVKLSVQNGVLKASLDSDLQLAGALKSPLVRISIPNNGKISSVEISGASQVDIKPHIAVENFKAEVCGASSFTGDISASLCKMEVSGASSASLAFDGGTLDLGVFGASSCRGDIKAVKSSVDVSGASAVRLKGESGSADIEVTGASTFDGGDFVTHICTAEASGVSKAVVNCTESLSAEASGVSKISYSGGCHLAKVSSSDTSKVSNK